MAKKPTPAKKVSSRSKAAKGAPAKRVKAKAKNGSDTFAPPKSPFPKPAARKVPDGMTEQAPVRPKKPGAIAGSEPEAAGGGLRETIYVLNVLAPGKRYRREAKKYWLARKALLKLLPTAAPGLTQTEMSVKMRAMLPPAEFPGTTSSWWMKTAQLDLEARGMVARDDGKPLRWIQVGRG